MIPLGELLAGARKVHNMTLKQLSEVTGLSVGYLGDIEHGRTEPSLRTLVKLADAYETTVSVMLTNADLGELALHPEYKEIPF
jgi:transcriptional regulator with XRE-family HTH domain